MATLEVIGPIQAVEDEIRAINEKLALVEASIATEQNEEERRYLQKKEDQLRTEKAQLRRKEELLLVAASTSAPPTLLHQSPKEKLIKLLAQFGMNIDASSAIVSRITESPWLSSRLLVCSTKEEALLIYESANRIPQSKTRAIAMKHGFTIDGELHFSGVQTASFFRAFQYIKLPLVLKINREPSKSRSECCLFNELRVEVEAAGVPLVPVQLLELDKKSVHQTKASPERAMSPFLGLLMPSYSHSFNDLPKPISISYALEVFDRIILAIEFIHDRQWMHGDVKSGNIFCDYLGAPWLGDYGSSIKHKFISSGFTGGTPFYQCVDVSPFDSPRLFDGIGLILSLLDKLDVMELRQEQTFDDVLLALDSLSPSPPSSPPPSSSSSPSASSSSSSPPPPSSSSSSLLLPAAQAAKDESLELLHARLLGWVHSNR